MTERSSGSDEGLVLEQNRPASGEGRGGAGHRGEPVQLSGKVQRGVHTIHLMKESSLGKNTYFLRAGCHFCDEKTCMCVYFYSFIKKIWKVTQ